jgi:hypothetical protein
VPGIPLPVGPTEVRQRYVPPGGWQPGTYDFAITVEAVDPTSGTTTVLATAEASTPVVVE